MSQKARDARMPALPDELAHDGFTAADLAYVENCRPLCEHRLTKYRFMDIVLAAVHETLRQEHESVRRTFHWMFPASVAKASETSDQHASPKSHRPARMLRSSALSSAVPCTIRYFLFDSFRA